SRLIFDVSSFRAFLIGTTSIHVIANIMDRSIRTDNPRLPFQNFWSLVDHVAHLTFEIFHTPLDDDASCEHSQGDIKCKAFINHEIGQLTLYQEKQHVFNVLNAKPFEISFLEFVELVIISTYSDPIQMLVVMPFGDLKLYDSDDSTFGVDISSRFPIDRKSIELLTFAPPMRDFPESMFVIANQYLTLHCTTMQILKVVVDDVIERYNATSSRIRLLQERTQALLDSCMILPSARRLDRLIVQESECLL
nr:hypothetical protein [Tanacetum cinerariifolium]